MDIQEQTDLARKDLEEALKLVDIATDKRKQIDLDIEKMGETTAEIQRLKDEVIDLSRQKDDAIAATLKIQNDGAIKDAEDQKTYETHRANLKSDLDGIMSNISVGTKRLQDITAINVETLDQIEKKKEELAILEKKKTDVAAEVLVLEAKRNEFTDVIKKLEDTRTETEPQIINLTAKKENLNAEIDKKMFDFESEIAARKVDLDAKESDLREREGTLSLQLTWYEDKKAKLITFRNELEKAWGKKTYIMFDEK